MESAEKPLFQASLHYIIPWRGGEVIYSDKEWSYGKIFVTNKYLWIEKKETYMRIPTDKILSVSREASGNSEHREYKILIVDYDDGSGVSKTALFSGFPYIINVMKNHLAVLIGAEPKIEQKATTTENRLMVLLSLGIYDFTAIMYLLGISEPELLKCFDELKNWGLLDYAGKLTIDGLKYVQKIQSIR